MVAGVWCGAGEWGFKFYNYGMAVWYVVEL